MSTAPSSKLPWWSWAAPALAWIMMAVGMLASARGGLGVALAVACGGVLIATVFAAVYHAEVVAHRLGEPFGTLVLAVAVTVIEVALIVSVMLGAPEAKAGLARDTVFAAVMIVCNGIVGLSLLVGGVRHHEQGFQVQGASAAMAVLAALTTLTLVLPNFTESAPGPAVLVGATGVRGRHLAGAVRLLRVRADDPASRLFPARGRRRRGRACAAAGAGRGAAQHGAAGGGAGRGGRAGENC